MARILSVIAGAAFALSTVVSVQAQDIGGSVSGAVSGAVDAAAGGIGAGAGIGSSVEGSTAIGRDGARLGASQRTSVDARAGAQARTRDSSGNRAPDRSGARDRTVTGSISAGSAECGALPANARYNDCWR